MQPQSNQRGIETREVVGIAKELHAGLNRTSVGLKHGRALTALATWASLNRTSVGLKLENACPRMNSTGMPQSNQRGIETQAAGGLQDVGGPRLNRTSVGLKPLRLFPILAAAGQRLNRTSVGLKRQR